MLKRLLQLACMLAAAWAFGFALFFWSITAAKPYKGRAEAIAVMTGGKGRVETGLELLAKGKAGYLLISGVYDRVTADELLEINHHDQSLASKITLGKSAFDTFGNAAETLEWVERHRIQSLIIVTAHFHMPRTMMHLGAQLPDIALYPYPVLSDLFRAKDWYKQWAPWRMMLTEYTKLIFTYPQILIVKNF
jgi:uncharacterized SAM-binding protein YcdF (DUF218 family)